jgi:uncharacterized membrane protein YphA (DoxX/SURF4 family)
MWYAATVVRILVGLAFLASGIMYFVFLARGEQLPLPDQGDARDFAQALGNSKFMVAVKVLEVVGGLLLLSGYFVPVGLCILGPVVVNIFLFDVFLARTPADITVGSVFLALLVFLIYAYRKHFGPIFDPAARPG